MKKFKELRLTIFILFLFVGILFFSIQAIIKKDISLIIITLTLLFVCFIVLKMSMYILDDCIMIYEYKWIGILPTIVQYADVKNVNVISKHRVQIVHQKKSIVYVFDSSKFVESLDKALDQYRIQKKREIK